MVTIRQGFLRKRRNGRKRAQGPTLAGRALRVLLATSLVFSSWSLFVKDESPAAPEAWELQSDSSQRIPTERSALAAARGPDGRIWALGGYLVGTSAGSEQRALKTAESYAPCGIGTGTWAAMPPLNVGRSSLAAATTPSGRLYAIGGADRDGNSLGTVEYFDAGTNGWVSSSPTGDPHPPAGAPAPMPTPRARLAAVATNGLIYAIGGQVAAGDSTTQAVVPAAVSTVEAYDPESNSWSTVPPMLVARAGAAATVGSDGRIYVMGGAVDTTANFTSRVTAQTAEVFDPATDSWSRLPDMPTPRTGLAATTGPDGRIWAVGGFHFQQIPAVNERYRAPEIYTPGPTGAAGTWETDPDKLPRLKVGRHNLAATTDSLGRIFAFGGEGSGTPDDPAGSRVESYPSCSVAPPTTTTPTTVTPTTLVPPPPHEPGTWQPVTPMGTRRRNFAAAVAGDGRIYALGGTGTIGARCNRGGCEHLATVEAFDPAHPESGWDNEVKAMNTARVGHAATSGRDGRIYVAGGIDADGKIVASAESYDPESGTWTVLRSMSTPRAMLAMATGPTDGRIYAIGGRNSGEGGVEPGGYPGGYLDSVEAFDPARPAEGWTPVAGPADKVLGPSNGAVPSLSSPRSDLAATAAANAIYALGGKNTYDLGSGSASRRAESYTAGARAWSTNASLSRDAAEGTAAVAARAPTDDPTDGIRVYLIGADNGTGVAVYDPVADQWAPADGEPPPPDTRRKSMAAVTGPDGRIYALGGADTVDPDNFKPLSSVEAYLPGSPPPPPPPPTSPTSPCTGSGAPGEWETLGQTNVSRTGLGAATDADGRVFAVGGLGFHPTGADSGTHTPEKTVEMCDPVADRWVLRTPMHQAREGVAVARGSDGRIHAIGGRAEINGDPTNTVEAYDPDTDRWSEPCHAAPCAPGAVPPLNLARLHAAAAVDRQGRIYVLGGFDHRTQLAPIGVVEVFDPANPARGWIPLGQPMPTPRALLGAATGPDGRIYTMGGTGSGAGDRSNLVEAFDPAVGTWETVAPLETPRHSLSAATGPDGIVYAIGGDTNIALDRQAPMEGYDTSTGSWYRMPQGAKREKGAATTGGDGRIYVVGRHIGLHPFVQAYTVAPLPVHRVETCDAANAIPPASSGVGAWQDAAAADMPAPNLDFPATTGPDGRIYTFGGGEDGLHNYVYDPGTDTWGPIPSPPFRRYFGSAAAATGADGRIYLFGGGGLDGQETRLLPSFGAEDEGRSVDVYNPCTGRWTRAHPMPVTRYQPAAAAGPDGRIYVFGASTGVGNAAAPDNTVQALDPFTNTWTPVAGHGSVAPLAHPRIRPAAAAGADGRIYAVGGVAGGLVEAYVPCTNTWLPVPPLPRYREELAAAAGPDGRVYALGGTPDTFGRVDWVDRYVPATNRWDEPGKPDEPGWWNMEFERKGLAAASGGDGRLYAIGGFGARFELHEVEALRPADHAPQVTSACPALSIFDTTVEEPRSGTAAATFRVGLDRPSAVPVTVDFTTSPGSAEPGDDYDSASGTVGFVPGETEKRVTVPVRADTVSERAETFHVTLSNPVGSLVSRRTAVGTITDSAGPAVSVSRVPSPSPTPTPAPSPPSSRSLSPPGPASKDPSLASRASTTSAAAGLLVPGANLPPSSLAQGTQIQAQQQTQQQAQQQAQAQLMAGIMNEKQRQAQVEKAGLDGKDAYLAAARRQTSPSFAWAFGWMAALATFGAGLAYRKQTSPQPARNRRK